MGAERRWEEKGIDFTNEKEGPVVLINRDCCIRRLHEKCATSWRKKYRQSGRDANSQTNVKHENGSEVPVNTTPLPCVRGDETRREARFATRTHRSFHDFRKVRMGFAETGKRKFNRPHAKEGGKKRKKKNFHEGGDAAM